jgi:hypothetical protein
MWKFIGSISDVPTDRDLHLAVLDGDQVHALVFTLSPSWELVDSCHN